MEVKKEPDWDIPGKNTYQNLPRNVFVFFNNNGWKNEILLVKSCYIYTAHLNK